MAEDSKTLVERLRAIINTQKYIPGSRDTLREAADEIARLRQELDELKHSLAANGPAVETAACPHEWVEAVAAPGFARCKRCEEKREVYGSPADHCEKHGLHRTFAGGCPQCYHEKYDLPRASEKTEGSHT